MATLVMKFGGTSVGSVEAIEQAVALVETHAPAWDRLVVVVSAMSGVTNALMEGAQAAAGGDERTYRAVVADLRVRHYRVIDALARSREARRTLLATVDDHLDDFTAFCHSVYILGEITPRAMDTISSLGERVNARLVAALLHQRGLSSRAVDATELIVTDNTFQNAVPLMGRTRQRVAARLGPLLEEGVIPVVTGFMGATAAGVTTTLGRGGSDYSAAILGACLDSDEVWTWTDVDGVMSADPRIVPDARVIPTLSYSEVSELAYFGAKVLHPRTMRPLIEGDIPLWVKNTFNPSCAGTCIVRRPENTPGTVKAVTAIRDLSMVVVQGRGMIGVPGIAARTFAAVAGQGASVLMIVQASSEQSICFALPTRAVPRVIAALEEAFALELARRDVERIWAQDDVVIVTAVGSGIRDTPGVAARIFGATGDAGTNVTAIAQGSSECGISLVVAAQDAERVIQQMHTEVIVNGRA
jgi:aspartate kinase